ncbi:phosphopantothenoylcysteine decarboxylase/phosphopantothenate--cysteine ligase [Microbacteriaceae bacterium SG_E_30_P1]|uniref:Coenzyme A biosynthesis bifunctional protein CoaBC n=1 Tax=Antiquaquibacter oligotrophicus TaxID=2880260 RepID=A0ABT6KML0_9MICO|nr:bifunctional phosphopantothenoylcysteine decarboxylase/phosphopantothenate--cysteine ligase CoaBC [Antiquaquibacter oligotrophicus]MDH6180970.1 phosphopantothenoylcysteine decarboxylase/phosphopantothenate--cysteine ligase [Antiquaquibacter oligotrophicus]UDF13330.1 bifunctional phosphopantothenoylcysteine decarboxylase/phosphopantothenate--cysteine ligase CoaBC [Antiquaquibacter oligotrophicus]
MSSSLTVVVGVTGGIAAYKAVSVVRALVLRGHDVHVVATENALRFVGRPTLEAISRNLVHSDLYEGVAEVRHVAIGQSADLIIVAPATANTIAKLAGGFADDLLGNTILASTAPLVIAPAMHTEMWQNPATVANIATLRSRGVTVVGPASGQLTGTDSGAGRMSEPDDIVEAALARVARSRDFDGVRVVVSAGGTREPLDPVRFLGNRSSGRQGIALAEAARDRGADVTLVAANLDVQPPQGMRVVPASTASELREIMHAESRDAGVVIMAAAVADYRPDTVSEGKIKKEDRGDTLQLTLVRNPDILRGLVEARANNQIIVGFAAETERNPDAFLDLGRAKVRRKGSDLLVLNRVGWTEGFATSGNEVVVLDTRGDIVGEASGSKRDVADRILDAIIRRQR